MYIGAIYEQRIEESKKGVFGKNIFLVGNKKKQMGGKERAIQTSIKIL